MYTTYFSFDRRNTHLETVLHTLSVSESQRRLIYSFFFLFFFSYIYTQKTVFWHLINFRPAWNEIERHGWQLVFLSASDCHRLGLDRIDDHDYCHHKLDTWSKLICKISFFSRCVQWCVICQMSQSSDMFFAWNGSSSIKRLKSKGSKTEPCSTPNYTESSEEIWGKTYCILVSR